MTDVAPYSGTDNLEIMEGAVRYNAFLRGLVAARASTDDAILDFGAGAGTLARPLVDAGYRVACVEPDEGLRARLASSGLTAYPELPDQAFDLIYSFNVLEHIADDRGTVAALGARLRPGGTLVIYVPAFPMLFGSMDRKVGHLRRYRRDELAALVREAGVKVETAVYRDCLGFCAALIFRFFGNDCGAIDPGGLVAYDRFVFPLSRWLDRWAGRWFGKNLLVVAKRNG
ncbi:MAG TPA: class I SAM-dependent methyltransferase [Stellaceae bacterium]|jgi:SAM-dependent methyltransferase